jgi:hypothetical protein
MGQVALLPRLSVVWENALLWLPNTFPCNFLLPPTDRYATLVHGDYKAMNVF